MSTVAPWQGRRRRLQPPIQPLETVDPSNQQPVSSGRCGFSSRRQCPQRTLAPGYCTRAMAGRRKRLLSGTVRRVGAVRRESFSKLGGNLGRSLTGLRRSERRTTTRWWYAASLVELAKRVKVVQGGRYPVAPRPRACHRVEARQREVNRREVAARLVRVVLG